jgi:hypothetical protein
MNSRAIGLAVLAMLALGACGDDVTPSDMADASASVPRDLATPDLTLPPDLRPCTADLKGTELQICGIPDASFDPGACRCVGDP